VRKKGSTEWTVGKLLSLVLLVVLLALVIWGISTGGLNPLIEKAGGMFDSVALLFGYGDIGVSEVDCVKEFLIESSSGESLLDILEIEGDDRSLIYWESCRSGVCSFKNNLAEGIDSYFILKGKFFKYDDSGKEGVPILLLDEDESLARFYSSLYNSVWGIDGEGGYGVDNYFYERITRQIILYGDGDGKGREVYAVWGNGGWLIMEDIGQDAKIAWTQHGPIETAGKTTSWVTIYPGNLDDFGEGYVYEKDSLGVESRSDISDVAIDRFLELTEGDSIYYLIASYDDFKGKAGPYSKGSWMSINDIVGNDGRNSRVDKKEEISVLKSWAKTQVKMFSTDDDAYSNYNKIKEMIDDEVVEVGGEEYILGVDYNNENVAIEMVSDKNKYRLNFAGIGPVSDVMWVLTGTPGDFSRFIYSELQKFNGASWEGVSESFQYDLPSDFHDLNYKRAKIYEFLGKRC